MSKYKLDDFFTATIQEKGSKLSLKYGDQDTDCYLIIKGLHAKSIEKQKREAQITMFGVDEKSKEIKDTKDRQVFIQESRAKVHKDLAVHLVSGWSFEEKITKKLVTKLIEENEGLADAIIAHSGDMAAYLEKK